jgi:hypothetical protein
MIAVIAGNYNEFQAFLQNISMDDRKDMEYIVSRSQVEGRKFKALLRVGTYFDRLDYPEIVKNVEASIG